MKEAQSFKNRFREDEWQKLLQDREFLLAWDTRNLNAVGEIASRVLYGHARNKKQFRELTDAKRATDTFW